MLSQYQKNAKLFRFLGALIIFYQKIFGIGQNLMEQRGMTFDQDFYVVVNVGKQCRAENAYAGLKHNIFI